MFVQAIVAATAVWALGFIAYIIGLLRYQQPRPNEGGGRMAAMALVGSVLGVFFIWLCVGWGVIMARAASRYKDTEHIEIEQQLETAKTKLKLLEGQLSATQDFRATERGD